MNFLSLLRAGHEDYVINAAALDYMLRRQVDPSLIEKLAAHLQKIFASQIAWLDHLARCAIDSYRHINLASAFLG